jgi:hypothetical protein
MSKVFILNFNTKNNLQNRNSVFWCCWAQEVQILGKNFVREHNFKALGVCQNYEKIFQLLNQLLS